MENLTKQKSIKDLAGELKNHTIELRRHFHMHPEPAMEEFQTSERVKAELDEIGIPYEVVAGTGVVAVINCKNQGRTVALRADMDALELTDEKEVPYKSQKDGLCHACGHDAHTAMLLTAARILNEKKDELDGTIKLIFQPGEESIIGAKTMMAESDFLDGVDGIFGMHMMISEPVGTIAYSEGASAASADGFKVRIKGKGGHGASPQLAVDAGLAASAIVLNTQSVVSRDIPPDAMGVITFGVISSGSRYNIIADEAFLEGTIRSYDNEVRSVLCKGVERVATEVAKGYKAEAEVSFFSSVNPLINDAVHTRLCVESAKKVVGEDRVVKVPPMTGSEDFSEFLTKVSGVYVSVGCRNEEKGIVNFHHHPKFDIDEDALVIGTEMYAQYACDFLAKEV